ncbi:flagellar filament capping protein FliD [Sphingomonas sp. 22L2VL55-3]
MVTSTTSTTATPTPTPTPTAQSAVNDATQALLKGLSAGSGVDTGTLVTSLVSAQFAARTAALKTKSDTITAQISGVGTLKSTMTGFSTALANLVKGGSLQTQPTSSNAAILSATAQSGAKLSGLSSSITVTRLATGQVARTTTPVAAADRTTSLNTGALTLTIGGKDTAIDVGDGSIDAIAAGINASKTGVTASVVTDANGGAYLSVKGATGSANAFTLKGEKGDALDIGGSTATKTSLVSTAQNAQLTVDGIAVERPSNTVSDLVTGVTLQLNSVSTVPVSLTSTPRPTR